MPQQNSSGPLPGAKEVTTQNSKRRDKGEIRVNLRRLREDYESEKHLHPGTDAIRSAAKRNGISRAGAASLLLNVSPIRINPRTMDREALKRLYEDLRIIGDVARVLRSSDRKVSIAMLYHKIPFGRRRSA